jgi:hypothetical protein
MSVFSWAQRLNSERLAMTSLRMSRIQRGATFALWMALTMAGVSLAQESRGGMEQRGSPHQHLDARYAHNRYYFDHGYRVSALPYTGVAIVYGEHGSLRFPASLLIGPACLTLCRKQRRRGGKSRAGTCFPSSKGPMGR